MDLGVKRVALPTNDISAFFCFVVLSCAPVASDRFMLFEIIICTGRRSR